MSFVLFEFIHLDYAVYKLAVICNPVSNEEENQLSLKSVYIYLVVYMKATRRNSSSLWFMQTWKFLLNMQTGNLLTTRESVSGKRNASSGPFSRFRWNLNTAVTILFGDAANKYIWKTLTITCLKSKFNNRYAIM